MKPMKTFFEIKLKALEIKTPSRPRRAFTLIELLTVIAIIGVLAGLIIATIGSVTRSRKISVARAELGVIESALDSYHAKYNTYPPDSTYGALTNQLYYELSGVKEDLNTKTYTTLDGSATILQSDFQNAFGAAGILNCTRGSGEDAVQAKDFLPGLKPNQIASVTAGGGVTVSNLITSVGGPDDTYQPMGEMHVNPIRYLYPGTNNPDRYDLWVQLVISGKTNLVCNWSHSVKINSPLP